MTKGIANTVKNILNVVLITSLNEGCQRHFEQTKYVLASFK